MTAGTLSSDTIGWMAIATGVAVIVAAILLVLFFIIGNPFGTLNDIFNGVAGISSGILAWMLYAEHHAKSPLLSQIAIGLESIGALVVVIGSVLIIFGITGWVLAGQYTGAGNALIGLWLVAFSYAMRNNDSLPNILVTLGLVTGALMAMGLFAIPGILAGIDSQESTPWYLKVAAASGLGFVVLYPYWCIWLGRALLHK